MVVWSPDETLELDNVDKVDVTVELDDAIPKLAPGNIRGLFDADRRVLVG